MPKGRPLSDRLFDAVNAEAELEDALSDAGVEFESLGWDGYDCSVEILGVPAGYRLSEAAQRIIHGAGFAKVYVHHADKWETHYGFKPGEPFAPSEGWRVSYPCRRGEPEKGILVEAPVPGWPPEWLETGYVIIVPTSSPDTSGS